jgi:hypothetical protein
MKDDNMILLRRTCATCCACCSDSGGECMNRVRFIVPSRHARDPLLSVCRNPMTQRESDAEDAAITVFWQRLGIAPRLGRVSD